MIAQGNIDQLRETVWRVNLVEILIPPTTVDGQEVINIVRFTDLHHNLTVGGNEYLATSGLLAIGKVVKDIAVKDESLIISLNGVEKSITSLVLGTKIKGSKIKLYRGLYDSSLGRLHADPWVAWAGRVDSVGIEDSTDLSSEDQGAITISVDCRSFVSVLRDRESGVYTNQRSWNKYYPSDNSMKNVAGLKEKQFDFGKEL